MWKIAVVDDDNIILRGLSRNIPWDSHGFQLAVTETNGEDALHAILREKPHIVITDIRMPFMDGLELTEIIKEKMPETKIILMTSYDEFEFAQKALKLKVFDFVLKPVENEKLLAAVRRAAAEWERDQSLVKKVIEGIPFLKQRFYENLFRGRIRENEIASELEFLEIPLQMNHYTVLLLIADAFFDSSHKNRFGQEMLKYCIFNLAEEIIEQQAQADSSTKGIVFESADDEIVIIAANDDKELTERQALKIAELIRQNVEQFLKTTVTIGIGAVTDHLAGVHRSYKQAKEATEIRHLSGTNQVLAFQNMLLKPEQGIIFPLKVEWRGELELKIKSGLEKEALLAISQIEQDIRSKYPVTLDRLQLLSMEIVFTVINAFHDWNEPPYQNEDMDLLFQELRQMRTAHMLFERIRVFIRATIAGVNEQRSRQQKHLIDQAVQYLQTHYSQEGLSLQDAADYVHISPTYLSMLFKKETGTNFSDFLTETRMKAAMRLLHATEMKAYEVSEQVGYSNPQYFSVSFKKFTGMSPSEFKQSR